MQRIYYYIVSLVLLLLIASSCSNDLDDYSGSDGETISIKLVQQRNYYAKTIDEDNLLIEQTVKNLSVFFTEPSSDVVTNKFIYTGFSSHDDYKIITLPLNPADLLSKDIYIIANYDNQAALQAVTTIDDISQLTTPVVDKNNNLTPENGICMYGNTLNHNFGPGSTTPVLVNLERTGAKMRVNLTFPENPTLSTNNSYLFEGMSTYTYVVKRDNMAIAQNAYYTHAAAFPLTDNGSQQYVSTSYLYESGQAPVLHLYTNIDGTQQSYSANLPKPMRNYLYDISVEVYGGPVPPGTRNAAMTKSSGYTYITSVKVYDENGQRVD